MAASRPLSNVDDANAPPSDGSLSFIDAFYPNDRSRYKGRDSCLVELAIPNS
jgi:hypothetical protein